mmetsp:Transcript_30653/g.43991  ORF Transcript_30653/g.43991 Transcript_30653/m.43991 type:complete len:328 (-) Transcript_30653:362-1345(-)
MSSTPTSLKNNGYLRRLANVVMIGTVVSVLLGTMLNFRGSKYTVVSSSNNISHNILHKSNCRKIALMVHVPNSIVCCSQSSDSLCQAILDPVNKILTSWPWAIVIPIIPFLINSIASIVLVLVHASLDHRKSLDSILSCFGSIMRRLLLYLGIIIFRMVVLYILPFRMQQWLSSPSSVQSCWCDSLVSKKKCSNEFDFSDHLVLAVVQYIIPSVLESHVSLVLITIRLPHSFISKIFYPDQGNNALISTSNKPSSIYDVVVLCHVCSLVASIGIVLLNFRSIFFTCRYFHTPFESIIGFCIAYFFSYHPLLRHSNIYNVVLNQLRHS